MKFTETLLNFYLFTMIVQHDFSHMKLICPVCICSAYKDIQIYELWKFCYEHIIFSIQLSDVFGGYLFQAVNTWPQFLWVISELDNHTKWVII